MNSYTDIERALSRREVLTRGLTWAGALAGAAAIPAWAQALTRPATASAPAPKGKARSVIQIWLAGGPCHIDTWDPKPDAGRDYFGQFDKPIPTNVPGIQIAQMLPLLAKQADRYSIIRSMTHGVNGHETASYYVQTGRKPGEGLVFPSVGAVVSFFKGYDAGYKGLIPPYIVLTELQGRFSEVGFLPQRYQPFATGGNPSQPRFVVEGVVAESVSDQRQRDRRELLASANTLAHALPDDEQLASARQAREQAYDLILGDAGKVFDLAQEKDDVRERYGRNKFGQSCLMARRLVEKGVPYVTINHGGWDTHKDHFPAMRRMLPEMDKALSALLSDLSERGLLESTIVWWSGEFGRTPKVQWEAPWNGGRGHYGAVFSAVVAGGGFQGGRVVGASDAKGEKVASRPVWPADVIESMYQLLGIDPAATLPGPGGRAIRVCPTPAESGSTAGPLKELM
ncbi:MAG: DUF1501 domain-containing protein [Planctomycetota bacterium]|nr:DUF1501 domain-containing protein [Planctomycetota bacterium]